MGRAGVVAAIGLIVAAVGPDAPLRLADGARVASHRGPPAAPVPARAPGTTAPGSGQEVDTLVVAPGAEVRVTLLDTLSTRASAVGDTFRAEVAAPVYDGQRVALPLGAPVTGLVTEVRESGGARERAVLHTGFLWVEVEGERTPFRAELVETNPVMRSRTGRLERTARIAGGAVLGGLVGGYLTGGGGALAGAAVGGLAGAVWVMSTQDVDVVLPAGSELLVRTTRAIEVVR